MPAYTDLEGRLATSRTCKKWLMLSAIIAFLSGLIFGILIAIVYFEREQVLEVNETNNSDEFVSFVENQKEQLISDGIFWGVKIEEALPEGYQKKKYDYWEKYLNNSVAVKLENGCGRMQNRMVVFQDGVKGCVRYRQNTDQIQGELFSFYLAQILKLPNLAPSSVTIVDLKNPLWSNLANDISSAQWSSNKPVVVTQYIDNLLYAQIPPLFKPTERHLNKHDIFNISSFLPQQEQLKNFIELAQWSDLIIFDYLTANLDRIVNNLYNYQWNVNIMDAPAHNLAKRADTDLLVFLDNESGLLHGYRLLKKYEVYHNILLENLCVFRKSTVQVIKKLRKNRDVGLLLKQMFDKNSDIVKDLLPMLPGKSVKILNERIEKVYGQIVKCESMFAET